MMNDLLFGSQQVKQRRGNLWGMIVPWVLQWCWSVVFSGKGGGGREVNYTAVSVWGCCLVTCQPDRAQE